MRIAIPLDKKEQKKQRRFAMRIKLKRNELRRTKMKTKLSVGVILLVAAIAYTAISANERTFAQGRGSGRGNWMGSLVACAGPVRYGAVVEGGSAANGDLTTRDFNDSHSIRIRRCMG